MTLGLVGFGLLARRFIATAGLWLRRLWLWCWRRCRRCHGHGIAASATDTDRILAFLDFQFLDVGFFQQFDQFLDLANVHRGALIHVSLWHAAVRASS